MIETKLKPIFILLMLAALASGIVSGTPESVALGPYTVSFDMGDIDYEIEIMDTKQSETFSGTEYTEYKLAILPTEENSFIVVWLSDYAGAFMTESFEEYYDAVGGYGSDVYLRTVDGKEVAMIRKEEMWSSDVGFLVAYTLEYDRWYDLEDGEFTGDRYNDRDALLAGKNFVTVESIASWDTTRQFLNTLHVEKIGMIDDENTMHPGNVSLLEGLEGLSQG